ncbi:MAG: Phenylalanine-tRNA ligase alpha subunit [Candidatus Magasanikbacteria bacterium GW2011_GWA2_56_11]|uniref:Phenylalanine--tRNA ligase alpha subunit n=1 Tax=Candidatus Magasanikbacteria bacterium GW2011_GWA2_56_11 TaxID=1619044 RepID=A0A0G2ANR7_9BACT|nr:MAG: Phenylalanine-tRNA ligase alpha subunit [Candidatus Magasanikbacteria bacterium GW2011_GWA2_56_11]
MAMRDDLYRIKQELADRLKTANDLPGWEALEAEYFSRTAGKFTNLIKKLKQLPEEERKIMGRLGNEVKDEMLSALSARRSFLEGARFARLAETEAIDVTAPFLPPLPMGHLHPTTHVQSDLEDLFTSMGFTILDGPELESEYYNFESVNIPADHPARDMQDTFYIKGHPHWVMRTHTSPVQVRALERYGVPIRAIVPGRCFRNEATDPRHEHTLYQLEGLVVDRQITFSHLKGILETVARYLYGEATQVRLRPKFYPFVEPGVNGEVTCFLCAGAGCRVCKETGWLEIFGAGMVHPNVLTAGGVDPREYQGFAFGLGLSRLVMLKYKIEDVRHLQTGDLRFLSQF